MVVELFLGMDYFTISDDLTNQSCAWVLTTRLLTLLIRALRGQDLRGTESAPVTLRYKVDKSQLHVVLPALF